MNGLINLTTDNHQALLIPSTFSLIVEHLNCEVNPLAQVIFISPFLFPLLFPLLLFSLFSSLFLILALKLSCARIVADCIAEFGNS